MPPKKGRRPSPRPTGHENRRYNEQRRPDMPQNSRRGTWENQPPVPPRGRSPDMYQFRGNSSRGDDDHRRDGNRAGHGDSYRGGRQDGHRDGQRRDREFSFNMPGPRFEPPQDDNRYPPFRRASPPRGPRRDVKRNAQRRDQGFRGGWQKRGASNRHMLQSRRETTPELLEGMGTGTNFKALEDLSDSGAEMDLSDNEASNTGDRPTKRARTNLEASENIPKWSNPDPYTSLPPPDESTSKKKDVVKLIRKAKVAGEGEVPSQNAAADNADFISFNIEDEGEAATDSDGGSRGSLVMGVTGQRRTASTFSHLDHLHSDRMTMPPSRPLADRIERAVPTVGLDTWPPPSNGAAVAGSRRRPNLDDAPPSHPQKGAGVSQAGLPKGKKRKRPLPIDGSVVEEWEAVPDEDDRPWCTNDHSETESMGLWLHKEVRDFYDYVRPYHFEASIRDELISRVSRVLSGAHPNGRLYPFGSYAAGIYLPTADLDLVFVSNNYLRGGEPVFCRNKGWMFQAMNKLVRQGVAKPGGEVIWSAKVPILKITDPVTNLRVDISFENMTGVTANQTFQDWKQEHPAMPILVTLIKQFLLMRDLNEVHTGGIGGFTVTCLVISLLQHLPAVQSGDMRAEEHLGEVLMDFLDLYGNKFNYKTTGINMSPPGYFKKPRDAKPDRLKLIDPNKPDNDISGGSAKVALVFDTFREAYAKLQRRMADLEKLSVDRRRNESILSAVLGGNYRSFKYQREHLKRMYDR